ncbi:GntR family transcriptional regulator [Prolixibacter sp. NT017]|uniref:GntR family transcriptional regulator n=1 Tax=Prolixibacter sp. NT017 TaxID=2652390 RepID=UPI0012823C37|nr:GntR family transcriptional regulator [Prolixibacter sp. NT017]GET23789.1 transcriptional regulator [Prolixibacter sp. NT017]
MNQVKLNHIFQIDETAGIPKYRQIISSVYKAIEQGNLKKGDKIPSLNEICQSFDLSRDTVMVALNELKARGVVSSVPGKGYYIDSTVLDYEKRIFVLFDELNVFKEDLYNAFTSQLDNKTSVDIYFHHFNFNLFEKLVTEAVGKYSAYVIMPATFDNTSQVIRHLPNDKVYILDREKADLEDYPVIFQDFEQDVIDALTDGRDLLEKYDKLVMHFPGGKEPEGRVEGFKRFCEENGIEHEVIYSLSSRKVKKGEAYFVMSDRNLVRMVKKAAEENLTLGKDLGLVSFNDTVLKEVVAGGITTISTDFKLMGETLAELVERKTSGKLRNPSALIRRNSL